MFYGPCGPFDELCGGDPGSFFWCELYGICGSSGFLPIIDPPGGGGGRGSGPTMRAFKPPPCVMQDELAGSLDFKFLAGLGAKGKVDLGASLYKSFVTGDTGAQMAAQLGLLGVGADRPTPPGGSITGGAEPANVVWNFGPYTRTLRPVCLGS